MWTLHSFFFFLHGFYILYGVGWGLGVGKGKPQPQVYIVLQYVICYIFIVSKQTNKQTWKGSKLSEITTSVFILPSISLPGRLTTNLSTYKLVSLLSIQRASPYIV